jgi:hypothetical protein
MVGVGVLVAVFVFVGVLVGVLVKVGVGVCVGQIKLLVQSVQLSYSNIVVMLVQFVLD